MEPNRPRAPIPCQAPAEAIARLSELVSALSTAIRHGAEPLRRRIDDYLAILPPNPDDPVLKALQSLPPICDDMIGLSQIYHDLASRLRSLTEANLRASDLARSLRDLARALRESDLPPLRTVRIMVPEGKIPIFTDPARFTEALHALLRALVRSKPAGSDPASVEAVPSEASWSVVIRVPSRPPSPFDIHCLAQGLFPLPHEATGEFSPEEVETALAREALLQVGGHLSLVRTGTESTVVAVSLPMAG